MPDLLTGDEDRFYEVLVRALTQGIELYGHGSMLPGGISLAGRRVVVFVLEDGDWCAVRSGVGIDQQADRSKT